VPRRKPETKAQNKYTQKAGKRFDGELYARPSPNPFSENWKDGFLTGYDDEPMIELHDKEWRDGYHTGQDQMWWDEEELDHASSSNT
jgi:hypothetical protein